MKIQTIIAAAVMASSTGLLAQTIYNWNGSTTGGGTGVNNTWDTTTANWTGPGTTWPSSGTANQAVFGGTAGNVTISGTVTANKLTFNTNGYTVTGGTSLALNGTTPTIETAVSTNTTISSVIAGSGASLTKTGAGTLTLSAINTYTGATRVEGGTLLVGVGGRILASTSLFIDGGTVSFATGNDSGRFDNESVTVQNGGVLSMGNTSNNFIRMGALTLHNGATLQTTTAANDNGSFQLTANVTVTGDTQSTISGGVGLSTVTGVTRTFDVANGAAAIDLQVDRVLNGSAGSNNSIIKAGAGTMVLSSNSTYTGTTTINDGVLRLASSGSFAGTMNTLSFGVSNTGSGVLDVENSAFSFNQTISLTLAPVTISNGSWNLFTGSQFGAGDLSLSALTSDLGAFALNSGVWELTDGGGRDWSFDQGTGVLSVIPEPSTHLLIAISLTAFVIFRRRRHTA